MKSKIIGLGDTIEQMAKITGVKTVAQAVGFMTGKDCGCNKRKEKLNKMFPYKNKK